MRHVECPRCGADITDTYERADSSVGIWTSSWFCADCQEIFEEDPQDDDYLEERRRDRD